MPCNHYNYGIIYNFLISYYCWVALALDTKRISDEILLRKKQNFALILLSFQVQDYVINVLIFALALKARFKRVKGQFIGIETITSNIS